MKAQQSKHPADAIGTPLSQFEIPASGSLQERRPQTLKHGDAFAVFDHNGDVLSGPGSPEGLYCRDTRYLSHLRLTVNEARPMLLSSTLRDDNAMLTCDLTNPDIYEGGEVVLAHDLIHVPAVEIPLECRLLRTPDNPQFRRPSAPHQAVLRIRSGLRRSVRGTRRPARASRRAASGIVARRRRDILLHRPRRMPS